jgi:GT2 family glycosyltransferase
MSLLLSIVSHHQGDLVFKLLQDLQRLCLSMDFKVIVTQNTPERLSFTKNDFDFKLEIIENPFPKGFAANHNAAFRSDFSEFFGVLNPDLRLVQNPFILLLPHLTDLRIGLVAPKIVDGMNKVEDSARLLPTPFRLFKRYWRGKRERRGDYIMGDQIFFPDWVAGIFLLFPSRVFGELNGFDERYFLYFEDVDLCCRLRLAGYNIILDPWVSVVHNARRDSHTKIQYLSWHILSGMRFFSSRVFGVTWLRQAKQGDQKHL